MSKRYFEFSEGTSNKFWEVWIEGNQVLTRYGKIGANGQTTVKDEGSAAGAQKLYDKLIKEKTGKGYAEKGGAPAAAPAAPAPAPAKKMKEAEKRVKEPAEEKAPAPPRADVVVEPGFRRFEFVEGTSSKFWEVKVEGEMQIVRYGKIGTEGQTKEKDFDGPAEAKADTKKLIAEKTGKGYVEVGVKKAPSNPELEAGVAANPSDTKAWRVYADWLLEKGAPWAEQLAAGLSGKPDTKKQKEVETEVLQGADGCSIEWENGVIVSADLQPDEEDPENPPDAVLERILRHPAGRFVQKLTLGLPPNEDTDWHMEGLADAITECGPLPFLQSVDMSSNADHMDQPSWRRVGDISGFWAAAPNLKELLLQGASGSDGGKPIVLGDLNAPNLEKFFYTSGGLSKHVPTTIGAAKLPKLKHLELFFGSDNYGCDCTVASLKGILDGEGLPALKFLGIKNTELKEEELVKAVAGARILPRIEELDMSMGTLADKAAAVLVANAAKFKHLKKFNLEENYFSEADVAAIKKALPNAELGEQKDDEDPEYRYASITE